MSPAAYKRTINMTVSLAVSFGLLVLISVGAVLGLGLYSATTNTVNLMRDKAELTSTLMLTHIRRHLKPAEYQVAHVATAIADGTLDPTDKAALGKYLHGSLAGLPQIRGLVFVNTGYQLVGAHRLKRGAKTLSTDLSNDIATRNSFDAMKKMKRAAHWGSLVWSREFGETLLNLRQPIYRDGEFVGVVVALVSIRELSDHVASIFRLSRSASFILEGRDRVVAHAEMKSHMAALNARQPLPLLATYGDKILRHMFDEDRRVSSPMKLRAPLKNHTVKIGEERYVFQWQEVRGFSDKPWIVGSYFNVDEIGREVQRLIRSGIAGLVALLLAVILAIYVGRRIARPVKRLSAAAEKIGALDLAGVEELPGSRITELNQQARAFNSMIGGLRWFEHYVPKPLVRRLLEQGEAAETSSDNRNLTVMFTDIVGFSTFAEGRPAAEVAAYLNDHFGILARSIEETGGTVDKFIGDSVMAFWGAPEKLKDRAERACRSAQLIHERLAAENERRRAKGISPMQIRIGIHSGRATVGNIGSPDRVNYTVVGDMVNVAARMEQLGKELVTDGRDVTVLITDATREDLSVAFSPISLGTCQVKGREEPVEVFDLLPPQG